MRWAKRFSRKCCCKATPEYWQKGLISRCFWEKFMLYQLNRVKLCTFLWKTMDFKIDVPVARNVNILNTIFLRLNEPQLKINCASKYENIDLVLVLLMIPKSCFLLFFTNILQVDMWVWLRHQPPYHNKWRI